MIKMSEKQITGRKRTASGWCKFFGISIMDADGWPKKRIPEKQELTLKQFLDRSGKSTCKLSEIYVLVSFLHSKAYHEKPKPGFRLSNSLTIRSALLILRALDHEDDLIHIGKEATTPEEFITAFGGALDKYSLVSVGQDTPANKLRISYYAMVGPKRGTKVRGTLASMVRDRLMVRQ